MLTKHQEEYVLDFLSGSGPMGELFLCCKNRFDIAGAKIFPAQAFDCDYTEGSSITLGMKKRIFACDKNGRMRNLVTLLRSLPFSHVTRR